MSTSTSSRCSRDSDQKKYREWPSTVSTSRKLHSINSRELKLTLLQMSIRSRLKRSHWPNGMTKASGYTCPRNTQPTSLSPNTKDNKKTCLTQLHHVLMTHWHATSWAIWMASMTAAKLQEQLTCSARETPCVHTHSPPSQRDAHTWRKGSDLSQLLSLEW